MVRLGASNSAGMQLCSARQLAFATPDEFTNNAARGLDRGNGRVHLPPGITPDALGPLDTGWQLEQRRDL